LKINIEKATNDNYIFIPNGIRKIFSGNKILFNNKKFFLLKILMLFHLLKLIIKFFLFNK